MDPLTALIAQLVALSCQIDHMNMNATHTPTAMCEFYNGFYSSIEHWKPDIP